MCDPPVGAILHNPPLKLAMQVPRNKAHGEREVRVMILALENLVYKHHDLLPEPVLWEEAVVAEGAERNKL